MRIKLLHIICLVFTTLLFACSRDAADELPTLTRAQLSIGLVNNGDAERQEEIKSIRFIVFGNATSGAILDVNKLVILDTPGTATDITAQLLKVVPNKDIIVIVIANEPQSLTAELNGITELPLLPRTGLLHCLYTGQQW